MDAEMQKTALVIGGTGMLRLCTEHIASKYDNIVVVARTATTATIGSGEHRGCHRLDLDYTAATFVQQLTVYLRTRRLQPTLCVCWMHEKGGDSRRQLLEWLGEQKTPVRVVQVHSSATAKTPEKRSLMEDMQSLARSAPNISNHAVILGFARESTTGRSRWLSDREISDGVVKALQQTATEISVVGQTEPWDQRP